MDAPAPDAKSDAQTEGLTDAKTDSHSRKKVDVEFHPTSADAVQHRQDEVEFEIGTLGRNCSESVF